MHRILIASLTIAFLIIGQSSSFARKRDMNPREFTQHLLRALQKNFPQMHYKMTEPLLITGKDKEGRASRISLSNSYPVYLSHVSPRRKIVEGHLNAVKLQFNKGAVVAANILPVLKPQSYFDAVVKQFADLKKTGAAMPLIYEKLNDSLYLFYVFDTPKSMRFVSKEDLVPLKLNVETLKQRALKNLEAYYKKSKAHFRPLPRDDQGAIYYFAAKETYEASALLLLDKPLWNNQKLAVKGKPVVFVPARNVLLITGSDDKKGLKNASEMARNFHQNYGYQISPHPMMLKNGKWQRFKP